MENVEQWWATTGFALTLHDGYESSDPRAQAIKELYAYAIKQARHITMLEDDRGSFECEFCLAQYSSDTSIEDRQAHWEHCPEHPARKRIKELEQELEIAKLVVKETEAQFYRALIAQMGRAVGGSISITTRDCRRISKEPLIHDYDTSRLLHTSRYPGS
jgi:hypothetical protein